MSRVWQFEHSRVYRTSLKNGCTVISPLLSTLNDGMSHVFAFVSNILVSLHRLLTRAFVFSALLVLYTCLTQLFS